VLELADELVAARQVLHRLQVLEAEIAHDREIVATVPEFTSTVESRRDAIAAIARELEGQWVDQGPLVSLWQRAVELTQLAEGSGADGGEYRADAEEARLRVETARLATRDTVERLCDEREALVDVLLAAPFELGSPGAVRDDGRPEAARRDALTMIEAAEAALAEAEQQRRRATARIEQAAGERSRLGDEEEITARISRLEQELPAVVELPGSAPPSAGVRLQRAGVRVTADAPA
jgi:hypothetical protein